MFGCFGSIALKRLPLWVCPGQVASRFLSRVLFSSPLGVPKVPLRHAANDRFSLRLSSDLGGVWLFRIHGTCPLSAYSQHLAYVKPMRRALCIYSLHSRPHALACMEGN